MTNPSEESSSLSSSESSSISITSGLAFVFCAVLVLVLLDVFFATIVLLLVFFLVFVLVDFFLGGFLVAGAFLVEIHPGPLLVGLDFLEDFDAAAEVAVSSRIGNRIRTLGFAALNRFIACGFRPIYTILLK